jgi:fatty-acyl-CoA synthase
VYLDGELYVTGRRADVIMSDGLQHYAQDIEATAQNASTIVRRGYLAAFSTNVGLVIIAERASGTRGADFAAAAEAIGAAVTHVHGLAVADLRFVPAGAIPRTTSGKVARRACRAEYLSGALRV